jgi:predicted DNA-binding transcriptional regulator AlpA
MERNMGTVDRALRWPEVEAITGVCRYTATQLEAQGLFPRRFSIGGGRAVAWLQSEIAAYIQDRADQRNHTEVSVEAKARRTPRSKWRQIADAQQGGSLIDA